MSLGQRSELAGKMSSIRTPNPDGFSVLRVLQYSSRKSDFQPMNKQSQFETEVCLTGILKDEGHVLGIVGAKEDAVVEVERDDGMRK